MRELPGEAGSAAAEFTLTLFKLRLFNGCSYPVFERFMKRVEDEY